MLPWLSKLSHLNKQLYVEQCFAGSQHALQLLFHNNYIRIKKIHIYILMLIYAAAATVMVQSSYFYWINICWFHHVCFTMYVVVGFDIFTHHSNMFASNFKRQITPIISCSGLWRSSVAHCIAKLDNHCIGQSLFAVPRDTMSRLHQQWPQSVKGIKL